MSILGPIIGGVLGLLGNSKSKQSGTQTTTQEPWKPAQPYILGQEEVLGEDGSVVTPGIPGLLPEANDWYSNVQKYLTDAGYDQNAVNQAFSQWIQGAMNGQAPGMSQTPDILYGQVASGHIGLDPTKASPQSLFGSLGPVNPIGAYDQALTGLPDNDYLGAGAAAAFNRSSVDYGNLVDDLTRNFQTQVAPTIRGGAIGAGQYGGSRQGIAEGLAMQDLNRQLSRNAYNLGQGANDAYMATLERANDAAKQQQLQAAGMLSNMAMGANQQGFGAQQQNIANRMSAANAMDSRQQQAYNQYWGNINNQGNLQNMMFGLGGQLMDQSAKPLQIYGNMVLPAANSGQQTSQPIYTNPMANMLGGASLGYGLFGGNNSSPPPTNYLSGNSSGSWLQPTPDYSDWGYKPSGTWGVD